MSTDIDLANLSLKDALDLAILIEEEARERYQELAEQLRFHHTAEAAKFFLKMADHEAEHGRALRESRTARFGDAPREVDRSMLWDVEAPGYDAARAHMSLHDALEAALAAEIRAWDFFAKALPQLGDPEVRTLFEELRDEEVEHQLMVRAEMTAAGDESNADPDDYVDPPRGL